jgi:Flp pilus assembly protein TadD
MVPSKVLPFLPRIWNAFLSYADYLGKVFVPRALAVSYPHPWNSAEGNLIPAVAGATALFLAISGAAWLLRKRQPWLLSGWGWYAVALLPVIGIVQSGEHGMADRYTYIPLVGIYFAAAWGAASLVGGKPRREAALAAVAAACVIALAVTARVQLSYWQSAKLLYAHTVEATDRKNYRAICMLAAVLYSEKNPVEAEKLYREAVALVPNGGDAWGLLGIVLFKEGKGGEAEEALRRSIELGRKDATEFQYLGVLLQQRGRHSEAVGMLSEAAILDPSSAQIRYNLALSEGFLGLYGEAERSYREAIRLRPRFFEAHNNLGFLLMSQGRRAEAEKLFLEALRIDPADPKVKDNLSKLRAGEKVVFPVDNAARKAG